MVDLTRLPTLAPELYVTHSRLAEARIPMGATLTHIYRARSWRLTDALLGAGYARRSRIRALNAARPAFVFVPIVPPKPQRTVPRAHRGRVA